MQKYRINLLLGLAVWIACSQVVDAAPRNRRRSRRSRSAVTSRTYRPQTTIVEPQRLPHVETSHPQSSSSNTIVWESATPLPVTTGEATPVPIIEEQSDVLAKAEPTPRPLDVGDALPLDPGPTDSEVRPATYVASTPSPGVSTPLPVVQHATPAVRPATATATATVVAPSTTTLAVASPSSAIAEVNSLRAERGLPPFVEDPSLSAVAYQKAAIQANRGAMGHPGGSMGGARFEGVGMGGRFTSCYLFSNVGRFAGAATVRGRNGQRFHCLLIR